MSRNASTARLGGIALVLGGLLACNGGSPETTAASCPAPTPEPLVGTQLATVDGQKVGSVSWEAFASRQTPENGATWSDAEKKKILDEAIDEELLFQEAFDRGLYQDPKVRKILTNLLLRQEIFEKVKNEDFSDADLQAYFEEHKDDFIVPEKVQLKRIFVAVTDQRPDSDAKALAQDLYGKVKADPEATFRDVAMASSEDPFAKRGGDVGYVDPSGKPGVPQEVVARAFMVEQGTVAEPFEAAGGYNILYVPTKRERIERSFDQMRGAVLRRMKNEKYEQLTKEFVTGLRGKSQVSVDEAGLTGWNPAPSDRPGMRIGGMAEAPPLDAPTPPQPALGELEGGDKNSEYRKEHPEQE